MPWVAPLKIVIALIGVFWMAIGAGWAVYWWATAAPLGWPNYRLGGKVIGITLHLPDSPGALLLADRAAAKKARDHAADVQQRQAQAGREIGLGDAVAQEHIHTVYRTIRKEIHDHVTPAIDRSFPLSVGLIRLHDAAAWGVPAAQLSGGPAQPDDTRSTVTGSDLAGAFVDNYGACRANAQQLNDLQVWVRKMDKISSVESGK